MNGNGEVEEGGARLGGFYAYKNTFNENNVWVDVPKTGRTVMQDTPVVISQG